MPGAGDFKERVRIERRALVDGERTGAWETYGTERAAYTWARGSETVMAQRVQGIQPLIITLRSNASTRAISNTFRVVDARTGAIYGVEAVSPSKDGPQFVDLVCADRGMRG